MLFFIYLKPLLRNKFHSPAFPAQAIDTFGFHPKNYNVKLQFKQEFFEKN